MSAAQNNAAVSYPASVHAPPPASHAPNVDTVASNTPQIPKKPQVTNVPSQRQPLQPPATNGTVPTHTEAAVTAYESSGAVVQTQWNSPNGAFSGFDCSSEPFF
ncbi:hypothetical protein PIIN_09377 [Serendipita indica DSM 11827]|uniref:Uncharacterized protein n=1 Tax=Serendipita indica (strain DSM 11827) TaxID=1109443 RepID=G4TVQ1_SERID|nr:hypothetical protein PIIN_09377 [Serendipita indica DSM 11827]